jgi:hypothetical protein
MGRCHALNDTILDLPLSSTATIRDRPQRLIVSETIQCPIILRPVAARPTSSNGPGAAWRSHDSASRPTESGEPKAVVGCGISAITTSSLRQAPPASGTIGPAPNDTDELSSSAWGGGVALLTATLPTHAGCVGCDSPDESPNLHFRRRPFHTVEFLFPHIRSAPSSHDRPDPPHFGLPFRPWPHTRYFFFSIGSAS